MWKIFKGPEITIIYLQFHNIFEMMLKDTFNDGLHFLEVQIIDGEDVQLFFARFVLLFDFLEQLGFQNLDLLCCKRH